MASSRHTIVRLQRGPHLTSTRTFAKGAGVLGYFEDTPEGAKPRAIKAANTKHAERRVAKGKPFLTI